MSSLDPAFLTLLATTAGAALFFGGGYYWRRPAWDTAMDDEGLGPSPLHTQGPDWSPGPRVSTRAEPPKEPAREIARVTPGDLLRDPPRSSSTDPQSQPLAGGRASKAPTQALTDLEPITAPDLSRVVATGDGRPAPLSPHEAELALEDLLDLVASRTLARNAFVLDDSGLPVSKLRHDYGAGAKLACVLRAQAALSTSFSPANEADLLQCGPIRLQRLSPTATLPGCWLALISAQRFAEASELVAVAKALVRGLGLTTAPRRVS